MTESLLRLFVGALALAAPACRSAEPYGREVPAEAAQPLPDQLNENYRSIESKDVAGWAERFESPEREIFARREQIADVLALEPGMDVADVGAGTGAFEPLLAERIGPTGTVYAVDIVPEFLARIERNAAEAGHGNVVTVLCTEKSVALPDASIDVALVCDAYHHFAYPQNTLASIWRALRPGGRLVLVEFVREEGQSRDWILEHVRAGQAEIAAEFEAAGFRRVAAPDVGLEENYVLVFEKGSGRR